LKIEEIILGYNYLNEIDELKSILQNSCKNVLGYLPVVKQTRLYKYYWGIENLK